MDEDTFDDIRWEQDEQEYRMDDLENKVDSLHTHGIWRFCLDLATCYMFLHYVLRLI